MPVIVASALAITLLAQEPGQPTLLELARSRGRTLRVIDVCGPVRTLRTLLDGTAFGFEGVVLEAESRLTADHHDLYTEYTFELRRVLHERPGGAPIPEWSTVHPFPFVFAPPRPTPGFTRGPRVQVRAPVGRVEVEGLVIAVQVNDLPVFRVGQHLVVFAFYHPQRKYWQVDIDGVLDVREGELVPLSKSLKVDSYRSTDALAAAIAVLARDRATAQ